MMFANVTWEEPTAEDNSKVPPRKTIRMILPDQTERETKAVKFPYKFCIGITKVQYIFSDEVKLETSCSFSVEVKGK